MTKKYFAITAKSGSNYVGWFVDPISAITTAPTRAGVEAKLPQILASYMLEAEDAVPEPRAQSLEDADPDSLEGAKSIRTLWVEPAPVSPVSLEIERAIKKAGLNQSEVARRAGMQRSAVARLVNPFYHGHSWDSLERIAAALGAQLTPPKFTHLKRHGHS